VKIVPLDGREAAWDDFVRDQPDGTFFHLSAWRRVIEAAFGHRAHYAAAEQDGALVGVLPLVQVRTRLFGHSLISSPFCVYGGALAADAEVFRALLRHAEGLREKLGASVAEMRFEKAPPDGWTDENWLCRPGLYVTFRRAITGDDEANLKAIPRKQRAMVRKGIERGLASRVDGNVDLLHAVYAESVRNLGTPVFSRKYFRILAQVFGEALDVVTVSDGQTPVAAVMNFYWRDEVLPYYGGGTAAARACHANDFLYWATMKHAAGRGCRLFDFGRSKEGTGSFAFKKNWGFAPAPLHYRFALPAGGKIPEVNPLNPKYRLMIEAWKRLPLPVANALGPALVRGVG
jgi:FemAB-related protein (PEP-CTERM system-associated)